MNVMPTPTASLVRYPGGRGRTCRAAFWLLCALSSSGLAAAPQVEPNDPFETWNRAVFEFNDGADRYVLKPVAEAYKSVTPKLVNEGVSNFFNNLSDVQTFANSLLQGKLHNAVVALNRVIFNSTFGVLGLIDLATGFELRAEDEDFGQTLAVWGWQDSSFLMLPLLGPSTVRDFSGRAVDMYTDPVRYSDEVHTDTLIAAKVIEVVDKRADILGAEHLMVGDDRYHFIRSAYFQNRQFRINDGVVDDPFADESFEDYEDF